MTDRFRSEFDSAHERPDVESYRPYFLGPIVTVQKGGVRYLVDGQQRITTLSLLLIYLRRSLADTNSDELSSLDSLIFSTRYGRKTFNLDVEERDRCMTAILNGEGYDPDGQPASVQNIWKRYDTICTRFPDDLQGKALAYFSDWLQDRVMFVDIGAPNQDMALEIFETMNDRGLRLSSTDMLKSFLLSEVRDEAVIRRPQHTLATPCRGVGRLRGERRRGVHEGLAARQLRADPAPTQVESRTPRLRHHRHGLPQVGSRQRHQHRPLPARRLPALR